MPNFARILYYLAGSMRRLYWNSQKMREYQEKRLRCVVNYAYDFVPFYHDWFKKAGIRPTDIKSLADLVKIPVVRKGELRLEEPCRLVSKAFDIRRLKAVRTSGSTGQPFKVFISSAEDDWRKAIYLRANISCGQKPRDRWVVITSPHHFGDTAGLQRWLGVFAQTCVSVFSLTDEQVRLVNEARPDVLDGYSGSLLLVAKEVDRRALKTIRPRIIFGTADLMDQDARKYVESVFNAPFYDQFGCAEVDRSAWQCPEKIGYHMDIDSVIVQYIDGDGNEVSLGEKGEIVYTSLFNYAQPLIRYGIEDVGAPLDEECSCGRRLPLMKVVEGRKDSFLVLPDGRMLSPMTFWSIMRLFEYADYIDQFLVVQRELKRIEIYVKKKVTNFSADFLGAKLVEHIEKCIKTKNASSTAFRITFVDEIPVQKSGKLQSVICLLPSVHRL